MKNKEPIRTRAYVRVGETWTDVDALDDEQRRTMATQIKRDYLNALFDGRGIRFEPGTSETAKKMEGVATP